jgi:hypothetical protein
LTWLKKPLSTNLLWYTVSKATGACVVGIGQG